MKNLISTLLIVFFIVGNVFAGGNILNDKYHWKPDKIEPRSVVKVSPPPTAGEIISPAEFSRAHGVYITWTNDNLLQGIIRDIAYEVSKDDTVYVAYASGQDTLCEKYFSANQVNMDNVKFISTDTINLSLWIRDFGPFYIYEDGLRAIVSYNYWYPEYDVFPEILAGEWGFEFYDVNVNLEGGNFMTDGNGMGFCSNRIFKLNNTWSEDSIHNNLKQYLGLDSLVIIRPMQNDGTEHIDMFCKLLNDTLFLVGEYLNESDAYGQNLKILNDNAESFSKMKTMDGRSFNVVRIPMPPYYQVGTNCYTSSYTNSLIINNKVLVPIYGDSLSGLDTQALNIYKEYMPDYEIIGLNSAEIIKSWGAVHCITKTHYHSNPLRIFCSHVDTIQADEVPVVKFRLNPSFNDMSASVFYKMESEVDFTGVEAELEGGIFSATLPEMTENFNYYITGTAKPGVEELNISLPDDAPANTFLAVVLPTSIKENMLAYKDIKLSNYPNPFKTKTTFKYSVKRNSNIALTIYNVHGRKVRSLTKGFHKAGSYRAVWYGMNKSGEQMSSGVYYSVLTIANDDVGIVTKKNEIVVIR